MRESESTLPEETTAGFGTGLQYGLLVGGLLWAAYFVQASLLDGPGWDVTLLPVVVIVSAGAVLVARRRPARRRAAWGLVAGVWVTLAIVFAAALVAFTLLRLE